MKKLMSVLLVALVTVVFGFTLSVAYPNPFMGHSLAPPLANCQAVTATTTDINAVQNAPPVYSNSDQVALIIDILTTGLTASPPIVNHIDWAAPSHSTEINTSPTLYTTGDRGVSLPCDLVNETTSNAKANTEYTALPKDIIGSSGALPYSGVEYVYLGKPVQVMTAMKEVEDQGDLNMT